MVVSTRLRTEMVSEYRAVWKVSWFSVTLIMSVTKLAEAQNYSYCINGGVNRITNFKGDVSSNMEGQAYYQSGMDCTWVLDAGEGGRVLVTVLSSSLQWAPNDATCTQYDHVEVRNGDTASGDVIVTWCGDRSPSTVISTGRYLYIKFKTKSQNNTGVRLKYETFDATLCPPGWREYSNHCYKVETHPLSWEDAHRYCVRDQSNLVSISSEAEQSFITDAVNSVTAGTAFYVWIGVRYVQQSSDWLWIDTSVSYLQSGWTKSGTTSGSGCGCIKPSTNSWISKLCTLDNISVCKMKKGAATQIFTIPADNPVRDEGSYWEFIVVGIIVIITACFIGNFIKAKCTGNVETSSENDSDVTRSTQVTQHQRPAPQLQVTRLRTRLQNLQDQARVRYTQNNNRVSHAANEDTLYQKDISDMPETGNIRAGALSPITSTFPSAPPMYDDEPRQGTFPVRTTAAPFDGIEEHSGTPPPSYEEVFGSEPHSK